MVEPGPLHAILQLFTFPIHSYTDIYCLTLISTFVRLKELACYLVG
jgi:hypothetical protein